MIVRPASETDIPALCRLMQSIQDLHAEAHPELFRPTLDPAATASFFADVLAKSSNLVLVAEVAGEAVGYVWCHEHLPVASFYRQAAHTAYINHISVASEHRGKGLGKALVEEVVAILKERGATRIGVDFWSFNDRARAFFTGLGFAVQREVASREL